MRIGYPSAVFPAVPQISVEAPQGWQPVHAPLTLFALKAPVVPGEFTPNLVVRAEHHAPGFDYRVGVDEIRQDTAGRDEGVVSEPFETTVSGIPFVGVNTSWIDPDVGTIVQVHLFGQVAGATDGASVFFVQFTAAMTAVQAETVYPVIQAMIAGTEIRVVDGE